MRREIVSFLQKRKYRLVIRWKRALQQSSGFDVLAGGSFPFTLIFRAFDEIVRLLKLDSVDEQPEPGRSILPAEPDAELPPVDLYMELFLTGRDVLGEFLERDATFCAAFGPGERLEMRAALERVVKKLIDHEMREHARLSALATSTHTDAVAGGSRPDSPNS